MTPLGSNLKNPEWRKFCRKNGSVFQQVSGINRRKGTVLSEKKFKDLSETTPKYNK